MRYEKRSRARPADLAALGDAMTVQDEVIDDARLAIGLLRGRREIDAERIFVVGHSLGGTVALLFAQFHPMRVDRLVLINPAAYPEGGTTPDWFWEVPGLAETVLGQVPTDWIARLALYLHFGNPHSMAFTLL